MGMWLFRRRHNRRKSAGGAEFPGSGLHEAGVRDPARFNNEAALASAAPERRRSRRGSRGKSGHEPRKLQRNRDTKRRYSFSPGRTDDIRVSPATDRLSLQPRPANVERGNRSDANRPLPAGKKLSRAGAQASETAQPDWQEMPILHKRKSSRKGKTEHDREAEIKAMVTFSPARPAADVNSSGRPMKRDSKKMRGRFSRNSDPSSDISLPLPESMRSSCSENSSHQPSYIISALDVLAPRPTIKYAENPKYAPGASGFGSIRSESGRRRLSDRKTVGEKELKANKRVDDLADDLSASELRELMERDQKRREKKKIAERLKMERRLARRQEKQRAEEAFAARHDASPPPNMERGVFGREVVGLGIGTSAVVTSSKRKGSDGSDNGRAKRPADAFRLDAGASTEAPGFHPSASVPMEYILPTSEDSEITAAVGGTAGEVVIIPGSPPRTHRHARGASSGSQISHPSTPEPTASVSAAIPQPRGQESLSQTATAPLKASPVKTSPMKMARSWSSFFKLRGLRRLSRGSAPSSFSNTSRDSMHSGGHSSNGPQYAPMRSASNVPKRTMSKFREHLPELPLSPPDSRLPSPEAGAVPPASVTHDLEDSRRHDTPTSEDLLADAAMMQDERPMSGHQMAEDPSPEPGNVISQSLASVDSEGSWLSGRKSGSKRNSALRQQRASLNSWRDQSVSEPAEDSGNTDDQCFARLTPSPDDQAMTNGESTGDPMPSSDDEDRAASLASVHSTWGAVGRRPTIVNRARARSTEGLLTQFDDDVGDDGPASPDSPVGNTVLQRATSVDVGQKQARHMSAGSARLLDLKPLASTDAKQGSLAEES